MAKSDSYGTIVRPWGAFQIIRTGDGYQVKIITIEAGQELSLQSHQRRSEHWVVLSGKATVQVGDKSFGLGAGDDADVPAGVKHRISNPGNSRLEILESQFGDYLGEDDIVRYEDRYGRA